MASIWFRNKAIAWILVFVFALTTVFSTGTAFAGTEKTHTLGSKIEDVGIYLWEYSEVWGCNFKVKDNMIVVYGRTGEENFYSDEKLTLMVSVSDDTRVYADQNGTIGTETSNIRISKMSEDSYYGYLWLSNAEKTVNERYLIKLLVSNDDATDPNGSATDPDGDLTYPDEEIIVPAEKEPYFTSIRFNYDDMDWPYEVADSSKSFSFKGETEQTVHINYNGNYGEIYPDIKLTGTDVSGEEFEYSGTLDENGECTISFVSANGKTYVVNVEDDAYSSLAEYDLYAKVWDGESWENYTDDDGSPLEATYGLYIDYEEAADEDGVTVEIPAFYNDEYGIRIPPAGYYFEGLKDVYYLGEDGKATAEFTCPSINGKVIYEYKVNFVLDTDGSSTDIFNVNLDYSAAGTVSNLPLDWEKLTENGELVYDIPAEIHENWRWCSVDIVTDKFSRIQYEMESATSPNGIEKQIEWGNVTWQPEFDNTGMDIFTFKVTSADGESERDYRITLTLEGVYESPDEDFAEEPSEMTVIYNERVGEWNTRYFRFDEENYKEVIINSNGGAADGGIIPENIRLTGVDVNGDDIELEGTLDENGECVISFTSANGEEYTVKIIDGAYLIYSDMEFYVHVWDGKSWETIYEEDGSEKKVERTLGICVDLDEAATDEGQTIKISAFFDKTFGIKTSTGVTGFTDYEDVYYLDEDGKATMTFSAVSVNGKKVYNYKVNFVLDENGGTADLTGVKVMYEDSSNWEMHSIELDADEATETGQLVYEVPAELHENWYMPYVVINTEDFATVQYEMGNATDPDGTEVRSEWGGTAWFPDFGDAGYDTFTFTVTSADGNMTQEYTIILCLEGLAEYPEENPVEEPYNMYAGVADDGSWAEHKVIFDGENQATVFFDPQAISIESDDVRLTGTDVDGTSIELYGEFDENGECEFTFTSANGENYTVTVVDGGYHIWTDIELYAQVWDGKSWIVEGDDSTKYENVCHLPVDLEAAESEEGQTLVVPYYYDTEYGIRMEGAVNSFDGLEDVYYLDENGKATAEFTCPSANGKVIHSYKFNFVKSTGGSTTDLEVFQLRWRERINGQSVWGFKDIDISAAMGSAGAVVEIPEEVLANALSYGIYAYSYDYAYFEHETTDENGNTVIKRNMDYLNWSPEFDDTDYDTVDFRVISANGENQQNYRVTVVKEGSEYEPPEDIPCVEHNYGDWDVVEDAICTEPGIKKRICTVCQDEEFSAISPLGHKLDGIFVFDDNEHWDVCERCLECFDTAAHEIIETVTIEPGCETPGEKEYTCKHCDYLDFEEIPATGHKYVSETVGPTCTEAGYTTYTCDCGDSYDEESEPALGHDYESTVKEPTCTEAGYTTNLCKRCHDSYIDQETPAKGHYYSDWMTVTEATCETEGLESRQCTSCGMEEQVTIPATGHEYIVYETVEPTCTEAGYITYKCACGDSYVEEGEPALRHDWDSKVTNPTCTAEGYTTHVCKRCLNSYVDGQTPALGHDLDGSFVFDEKEHWDVCPRCEDCFDTASHEIVETVTIEPDCDTPGEKEYTCKHCDYLDIEEIPALGHKLVKHKGKAATCTAKGYKAYEDCSRCDYTTHKAIAAKGHKWESFYTIDKKATTKAAGSKSKHCATCNAVKSGSKVTIAKISKTTVNTLVYNGKNRTQNVTVVNSKGKKLVKGTDFTVTYKNAKGTKAVTPKNVGTYKAVIKFKGMYSGTVTKTFKINPQETKITKLTKNGKKQFTVKWTKKTAQVTGYQIKYSMKQNMSNAKTVTVKSAKTTSKTIKQLKAKKKYYVQIRTYKTVNGTKYYSAWSGKKYVTTK